MRNTTFGTGTSAGVALAAMLLAAQVSAQTESSGSAPAVGQVFQRISGSVSQDLTLRDNFNFSGSGFQWNTTSRLAVTLRAENSRYQLAANSGVAFRLNNNGNGSVQQPALGLRFSTGNRRFNVNATGNYSKREITFDEVQPDLSTVRSQGDREQIRLSFGTSTAINQATSVNVSGNYGSVDFSPGSASLIPSVNYGINAGVNHQVTGRTSVSLNGGLSFFQPDSGLDAVTTSVGGGMRHSLDSTTTVNANFGISLTETDLSAGGSRSNSNFTYGLGINRQLPAGAISASLNQQLVPSASGALQVSTGLRAGYSERINQRARFGVNASYDIQEALGGGGSTTFMSVTPSYSVQLGRNVAANAAYSLQRNDAGDIAQSVNFSLSRDFNLPF